MSFVRVPGNPEPDGAEELWLDGRGGVRLRALIAPARGPARGTVIVSHGRTEFLEKYFEVMRELQGRGFAIFSMDWRGQGLSDRLLPDPLKGHLGSVDDAVQDLGDAIAALGPRLPRPHILLAHSMGGGIALRAMQTRRLTVDGAVFSAPMWGIASLSPLARRAAKFFTSIGMGGAFAPGAERKWRKEAFKKNIVTSDRERHARAQALVQVEPRLALAGVTLGWVDAAAEAIEGFTRTAALAHLRTPILIVSAGEEEIVDNESHEVIARLLPSAARIVIDGAKHEILMERDDLRAQFWAEFDRFADAAAPRRASAPA